MELKDIIEIKDLNDLQSMINEAKSLIIKCFGNWQTYEKAKANGITVFPSEIIAVDADEVMNLLSKMEYHGITINSYIHDIEYQDMKDKGFA